MSVSKPPLQQIPRSKLLRDPFIPREGNRLVSVDFDQVEFRMLAHLSQDAGLIKAFDGDGDFFANMASMAYGVPVQKKDAVRGAMKNIMYGIAYGAGEEKSALMTGLPQAEVAAFRAKVDHAFPGLKAYMSGMKRVADKNAGADGIPFVVTPMGRRQPADWFHDQWKYYALLNYQIQGAAADQFKATLVEMDKADLTELMILPVHDEIVLDVPANEAEEVARLTVECFEADTSWAVPLTAGSDILDRWGDKYK
jgi:DNA polymerase-1